MENLNQPLSEEKEFPSEAIAEINKTTGWILFIAIMSLIGNGLAVLGALGNILGGLAGQGLVNLITAGFSIFCAIQLINHSNNLKRFAQTGDQEAFVEASKNMYMYFMWSIIALIASFVLSIFA
jgi:hypothetical protein